MATAFSLHKSNFKPQGSVTVRGNRCISADVLILSHSILPKILHRGINVGISRQNEACRGRMPYMVQTSMNALLTQNQEFNIENYSGTAPRQPFSYCWVKRWIRSLSQELRNAPFDVVLALPTDESREPGPLTWQSECAYTKPATAPIAFHQSIVDNLQIGIPPKFDFLKGW